MFGNMGIWIALVLPAIILGFWAQSRVMGAYKKWSRVGSKGRITGAEAASAVMRAAGINNVEIVEIGGQLTDHYDPQKKRLALSRDNFRGTSLAAVGVAAHEAGHAIQDKQDYGPMRLRMGIVGITSAASQLLNILLIASIFGLGIGFGGTLLKVVVGCMLVITFFQLITLPVEFDASKRAREELLGLGIIRPDEQRGVVQTLNAAGWTYVAAFVASLAQLIYFASFLGGGDE